MGLHQPGGDHPAGGLHDLAGRAEVFADDGDPPVGNADVGQLVAIGQAAAAEQEIQQSGPIILADNGPVQGATSRLP